MQAMIDELAKQAAESLGQVSSKETLASFWQEYLSKNGKIPALMKNLRSVAPEERPRITATHPKNVRSNPSAGLRELVNA